MNTDRDIDSGMDADRDIDRDTDTERDTDSDTDRETDKDRDTDSDMDRDKGWDMGDKSAEAGSNILIDKIRDKLRISLGPAGREDFERKLGTVQAAKKNSTKL
jgi:serine-aspartate repeat-containing protein C/D/E